MINSIQTTSPYSTGFRSSQAVSAPAVSYDENNYDTVEISGKEEVKKKKGLSKVTKWAIGIGGTLAALVTAGVLVLKHENRKLAKLCKEKLKLSELPENISFQKAETKEDAVKFAKEVLGIKEVDESFTLDALNWANEGIVNVSNANKGKVFIPTALRFREMEKGVASADLSIKEDCFGELCINNKFFNDESLTKWLKKAFGYKDGVDYSNFTAPSESILKEKVSGIEYGINWSNIYQDLSTKFYRNPASLSIAEKRELFLTTQETMDEFAKYTKIRPLSILDKWKTSLDRVGITYNYDEIAKLPLKEQGEKISQLCSEYRQKTGKVFGLNSQLSNPMQTVYHEMGHLQDFAENLEKLSMKDTEWERFKKIFKNTKNKKNTQDELEAVGSRWNKITDGDVSGKTLKDLLNEDSERFKEILPDLYEHVTNPEIQKTAGKVSEYSQTGVGEFIAEVYAEMINGTKLPDDVLALYKKYNGPLPNGYK